MNNKTIDTNKYFESFLSKQSNMETLRFITCGSVDDGKSTLLGRMLFEANAIYEDELAKIKTHKFIDFSLFFDGLRAEREQSITIDVAYRYFMTDKRKFVVADSPGHEQYTRNMFTASTTADVAIILIDGRYGITDQTKRHTIICSIVGIKNIVLAINKMDLIKYSKKKYLTILKSYIEFAKNLNFKEIYSIPISALKGCNIIKSSKNTEWFKGKCLLEYLEDINLNINSTKSFLRFPIQFVNRPHQDFRGYSGSIESGELFVGQKVKIPPLQKTLKITEIITYDGKLKKAKKGDAVTIRLNEDVDVTRGRVIVDDRDKINTADHFQANIMWMDEKPGFVGRSYFLKIGTTLLNANITKIKHKINIDNLEKLSASKLIFNNIYVVSIKLNKETICDKFFDYPETGSFILIDKESYNTVGGGMINFVLHRSSNLFKQKFKITDKDRSVLNGHEAKVIWFTGLSGSGKSTIANELEKKLYSKGIRTFILDGDNVRHGLNSDIGFTDADRIENIRRVSEVAKLMFDAGLVVIVSFISPFRSERDMARKLFKRNQFFEVFVDTPLEIAEKRDPKGLYKKARRGLIPNFTGIDSPYQNPINPEIIIDTTTKNPKECCEIIEKKIFKNSTLIES